MQLVFIQKKKKCLINSVISVSNILGTKRAEKKRWGGVLGREGDVRNSTGAQYKKREKYERMILDYEK